MLYIALQIGFTQNFVERSWFKPGTIVPSCLNLNLLCNSIHSIDDKRQRDDIIAMHHRIYTRDLYNYDFKFVGAYNTTPVSREHGENKVFMINWSDQHRGIVAAYRVIE